LKASFAEIKEACNKIDELEDESHTDSDDEDGNQFLIVGCDAAALGLARAS
jgi:hypothetical protein